MSLPSEDVFSLQSIACLCLFSPVSRFSLVALFSFLSNAFLSSLSFLFSLTLFSRLSFLFSLTLFSCLTLVSSVYRLSLVSLLSSVQLFSLVSLFSLQSSAFPSVHSVRIDRFRAFPHRSVLAVRVQCILFSLRSLEWSQRCPQSFTGPNGREGN